VGDGGAAEPRSGVRLAVVAAGAELAGADVAGTGIASTDDGATVALPVADDVPQPTTSRNAVIHRVT